MVEGVAEKPARIGVYILEEDGLPENKRGVIDVLWEFKSNLFFLLEANGIAVKSWRARPF